MNQWCKCYENSIKKNEIGISLSFSCYIYIYIYNISLTAKMIHSSKIFVTITLKDANLRN